MLSSAFQWLCTHLNFKLASITPLPSSSFVAPPPASTQSLQCVTHAKHRGGLKGEVLVLNMEFDNMKPLHCLGC